MTRVCAQCLFVLCQTSPLKEGQISHGFCRECLLANMILAGLATAEEQAEYAALRAAHVELTVRLSPMAAFALEQLQAALSREHGAAPELADLGGLLLAREAHRRDFEPVPLSTYHLPLPAAPHEAAACPACDQGACDDHGGAEAAKPFYRVVARPRAWRPGEAAA